jgi:hypothetical protein
MTSSETRWFAVDVREFVGDRPQLEGKGSQYGARLIGRAYYRRSPSVMGKRHTTYGY